jgi:SAM-dependent methyltransferase
MTRSAVQGIKDFLTFPFRALTLFEQDRWSLSSLATERFFYVAKEVQGYCLDVGCGKHNRFITGFLNGHGKGIDVFPYEGLTEENVVEDITRFPFSGAHFDTVTFIANLNHVPRSLRDVELSEAHRCLKPGGNIVVTMGNPLAEILVHKLVWLYDRAFGTSLDVDSERGMHEEEEYYLTDGEIRERLFRAGFREIRKRYFASQWGLNHLLVARK